MEAQSTEQTNGGVDETKDDVGSQMVPVHLELHSTVRRLQNENGLLYGDHSRYRKYLTRKLRKLRKAIAMTYGRGRAFVKKEVTVETASAETLLIVALHVERAWSYAMQATRIPIQIHTHGIHARTYIPACAHPQIRSHVCFHA
jgi:hypothetical protein